MAAVLEPVVPIMVTARSMRPTFVMGAFEVVATIMVTEPEMPRLVMRPVVPARPRRMVLDPRRPRLRLEVPARRMPMMRELRSVTQHDAEIDRGHHIRVDRGRAVGGCWRRQDGAGAKRGGEQKIPVHGSSPKVFATMIQPASRHLNGA
jgi:hypothetical protein